MSFERPSVDPAYSDGHPLWSTGELRLLLADRHLDGEMLEEVRRDIGRRVIEANVDPSSVSPEAHRQLDHLQSLVDYRTMRANLNMPSLRPIPRFPH